MKICTLFCPVLIKRVNMLTACVFSCHQAGLNTAYLTISLTQVQDAGMLVFMSSTGDVAQWLDSDFKSEDPRFKSLARQGEKQFFCPSKSTLVHTCLFLTPFVCRKRVGLTVGGMKTLHTERKTSWEAPYYGCSLSLGKAAQISHALHWDKKIIESNVETNVI